MLSFCFLVVYKPGVESTLEPMSNGDARAGTNVLRCAKNIQENICIENKKRAWATLQEAVTSPLLAKQRDC